MKNHQSVAFVSREAYDLFSDEEWASLLRSRGVDLTRPIRYGITIIGVSIYYDDTFIGKDI